MERAGLTSFAELLARCGRSAVHLEMRDQYTADSDAEEIAMWRRGHRIDWDNRAEWWMPFYGHVADAVARGVVVRRARIISEPVSEYIRWEHYVTQGNVLAGEQVRWLPRRRGADLALPGTDFWLFDDQLVRLGHFSGDGHLVEHEVADDPATVALCTAAFEQVWERAIPHQEYEPH
jgi:uncharacterized protein DUF6879